MKSLYSPEQRSADLDKEERLLKNDNDKINNLSKKLKKGLPDNEYNKIIDDINKADKKRKKRIEKIKKIKIGKIKKIKEDKSKKGNIEKVDVDEIMELFYPPQKRSANFEGNIEKVDVEEIMELLYPPEQRKADLDTEEMLLKIDNDNISNLNKKLKKDLPDDEFNKIVDDINELDK